MKKFKTSLAALALALVATSNTWAAWPEDKPIEVVVGFAPGGGTDLMARKLLPFVQKRLAAGAQFVVVNKPGASGEIANSYVAKAKPDGYTLAIVNVPGFLFVPLSKKAQYQSEDFQLIARVVDDPTVLVTRADGKINSLQTVIGVAKQTPGALSAGHNGDGTNGDLALQLLKTAAGIDLTLVPYKGTGLQKTDLLGGHITLGTMSAGEIPELHKGGSGNLRAVVQFTSKRSAALPQVPTATELGVNALMSSERGFAAPKGVSADVMKKLEQAIAESLKDPEFLANATADAPVIAYLPGAQWQKSLEHNRVALQKLANSRNK